MNRILNLDDHYPIVDRNATSLIVPCAEVASIWSNPESARTMKRMESRDSSLRVDWMSTVSITALDEEFHSEPASIWTWLRGLTPVEGSRNVFSKGVSPGFSDQVISVINDLPSAVRVALEKSGVKIVLVKNVTDHAPTTKLLHPRGYEEGSSFDQVAAFYNGPFGQIVVSEDHAGNNLKEILEHEIGHAINTIRGGNLARFFGGFSESDEFKRAYAMDQLAITNNMAVEARYYLQEGSAGRSETFAQIFNEVIDADLEAKQMKVWFPNTYQVVRAEIQKLECQAKEAEHRSFNQCPAH